MGPGFKRREMLKGSLAVGAMLTLPGRAASQSLETLPPAPTADFNAQFDAAFARPATAPAEASDFTPYHRKILEVARRERDRAGNALWRADVVAIADFAQPSARERLFFVDIERGKVDGFLVAHGRGSDPEHDGWLKLFSNREGSEATSRGAYLTGSWYNGKYGTSIRLHGLDPDNSNAFERAIVMHPAWYAAPDMLPRYGKLGRSEGCFAMAPEQFEEALVRMAGGRLLYADRIGEG